MSGEEPAAHADYWVATLAGAPAVISLPTDRPRPPEQVFRGDRVPVAVDEDLTQALRDLAADNDVSLYATVLTGWSVLLSLLSGQDDIVVGAPTSNRRRGDVEGLIGFFVNTLALRADLSGSPSVSDALEQVNQRIREALAARRPALRAGRGTGQPAAEPRLHGTVPDHVRLGPLHAEGARTPGHEGRVAAGRRPRPREVRPGPGAGRRGPAPHRGDRLRGGALRPGHRRAATYASSCACCA